MSTQPIARRRPRPVHRRPELRRLLSIGVAFAVVFAVAFLLGHTGSAAGGHERLPPGLPRVETPVPSALPEAPPIELGVVQPPPAPAPQPAPSVTTAPLRTTAPPSSVTPAPVTPEPQPTVQSQTPTVTTPPVHTTTPSPAPSKPSGSGQGQSFESSE
jgi:hypothetical protein